MKIKIETTRKEFDSIIKMFSVAGFPVSVEEKEEGPFSSDFYCENGNMVVVVEIDPRFSIQVFGILTKHSATLKNIFGMAKNMFCLGKNMLESFVHDIEEACKDYKEQHIDIVDKKEN